jgi:UDP:flavonoid glycosyltransferase YjiC (YdhE family)
MKRILFSGDGSSGDLLPMVLMAREFKLAGYDVCVCGSAEFSQMASDFEVPYEPYHHNYSELYLEKQKTGYIHNMRENIRHQEKLYQTEYEVLSKIAPQYDVLFNLLHEIFVPSIAEAVDIPNIKLFLFPLVHSARYAPPTGFPFITENKWINAMEWNAALWAARHLFSYNKTVNRLRGELGLSPVDDLLMNNSKCDHMMIGLYEELMPSCSTWKDFDYSYIGPSLPQTRVPLSDDLEAFLQKGSKPVYIGFGSMRHANSEELTRTIVEAVKDAGVRAIIAQSASNIGGSLRDSDDLFVLKEYPIPHHVLFPRCKAAVHHGSWITTHLAAQAGIPQLVLPQASDQYLWGEIIAKKGLGPKWVDMNRLSQKKLSKAIEELTQREEFDTNARMLGQRVRGIDGAKNALRQFESLGGRLKGRTTVGMGDSYDTRTSAVG